MLGVATPDSGEEMGVEEGGGEDGREGGRRGREGEERTPGDVEEGGGGYRRGQVSTAALARPSPRRTSLGCSSALGTEPSSECAGPPAPEIEAAIPRSIRSFTCLFCTSPTLLCPIWHTPGPPQRVRPRSTSPAPNARAPAAMSLPPHLPRLPRSEAGKQAGRPGHPPLLPTGPGCGMNGPLLTAEARANMHTLPSQAQILFRNTHAYFRRRAGSI
ncbi:hypothetical protein BC628DRAFT_898810 [Trametes gibbosa]|nr:hypothetical protein BC628DRAFT_898810 [Trametes gibbosa]